MLLSKRAIQYLATVASALEEGSLPEDALTERCPECGELATPLDNDEHIVLRRVVEDDHDTVIVVIGCEGYWVINPNVVGIRSNTWQDWRTAGVAVPWKDQDAPPQGAYDPQVAAFRAVNELRVLLREWRQYDDTAIVTLTERLLTHYGFFGEANHAAADERHEQFRDGVAEDDLAYDGWSNEPQKRALTARERDILCRILSDILLAIDRDLPDYRVCVEQQEIEQLREMKSVLYTRRD